MPDITIRNMRVGERDTVGYDFADDLAANEYFTSANAALDTGLANNGSPVIGGNNNTQISQSFTVSNNTADGYYKITITGATDGSNIKKKVYLIRVVTDIAPTAANANTALVKLSEAKVYIGKVTDEDDWTIDMIIDSVSKSFDTYTDRKLAYASYTNEAYDGNGYEIFYLRNFPVSGNMTVTENDTTLTAGNENDYLCYNDTGRMQRMNNVWYLGPKEVQVTYNAGYVLAGANMNLPVAVRLAALKQVAYEYKRVKAQDWGETSHSAAETSTTVTQEGLLKDVALTLDQYKRWTI